MYSSNNNNNQNDNGMESTIQRSDSSRQNKHNNSRCVRKARYVGDEARRASIR